MTSELIPAWAQALIEKVTVLNERLPNHIDATERAIADHESRLRIQEATLAQITSVLERLTKLEENADETSTKLDELQKRVWLAIGGITTVVTALELWSVFK
jgi:sirohydrochlorin ferrochelatase